MNFNVSDKRKANGKDWELILIYKELLSYLKLNEKLELRQTSMLISNKLKYLTLERLTIYRFNTIEFHYKGNEVGLSSDEVLRSQLEYIDKLHKKFRNSLRALTVGKSFNYTLIDELIPKFINLTKLNLVDIAIPEQNFINILNSLNNLKVLHLNQFVLVISNVKNYSPDSINFPKSLLILSYYNCKLIETNNIHPTDLANIFKKNNLDDLESWLFPTQSLKSLTSLTTFDHESVYIPTLNSLLQSNSNTTQYSGVLNCLDQTTIDLLSTKSCVKSLQLCSIMDGFELKIKEFKSLSSVTNMDILYIGPSAYSAIESIILSCPNLISLKLPWLWEFDNYFNKIVENSKKLNNLKIWNCAGSNFLRNSIPFNNSINFLEFNHFNPIYFEFYYVKNLIKLKRIRIEFNEININKYDNNNNNNNNNGMLDKLVELEEGWKLIKIENFQNYWKV